MDFQFDATVDGRRLKLRKVIDKHRPLYLAIRVGRRCKAKVVVAFLAQLTSIYPTRAFIRSDKGPGSMAEARRICFESSVTTMTAKIQPHPPFKISFGELLNGRFSDEFFITELSTTTPES